MKQRLTFQRYVYRWIAQDTLQWDRVQRWGPLSLFERRYGSAATDIFPGGGPSAIPKRTATPQETHGASVRKYTNPPPGAPSTPSDWAAEHQPAPTHSSCWARQQRPCKTRELHNPACACVSGSSRSKDARAFSETGVGARKRPATATPTPSPRKPTVNQPSGIWSRFDQDLIKIWGTIKFWSRFDQNLTTQTCPKSPRFQNRPNPDQILSTIWAPRAGARAAREPAGCPEVWVSFHWISHMAWPRIDPCPSQWGIHISGKPGACGHVVDFPC